MIWNLGKFTPYGECYPRDLFCQIVSNPMKGATAHRYEPERLFLGTVFVLTYKTAEG